MKALYYIEQGKVELKEIDIPKPSNNEVIVKVDTCGICGTDINIFKGVAYAKRNTVLGHEVSGVVVDVNNKNQGIKVGDKVVIDPNIFCGECYYCKKGKINHCENLKAIGININGGFAEYVSLPLSQIYKLPTDFSLDEASFAEPLSCCIHGVRRINLKVGESVVIAGAGTTGLLMLQLAKLNGAARIIVIEPEEKKQEIALSLGADFVFYPSDPALVSNIKDILNGGADIAIEASGNTEILKDLIKTLRKDGRILLFGIPPSNASSNYDIYFLVKNEITLISSLLNPYTFFDAVELLVSRKINVKPLTTKKIFIDQLADFFNLEQSTNKSIIKYQFNNKLKEAQ
ncbi:zinc-dependent alcohol dehydrogenase family protein [Melioribacter sp. OK-6-Me]|uniref:zinc-dependent alcohol dehydrogenase family protein n=1 Tax=unclassified Melioribacter TaxID=2627329 RepID=UPI003EDAF067